jgi:hypothetical protein
VPRRWSPQETHRRTAVFLNKKPERTLASVALTGLFGAVDRGIHKLMMGSAAAAAAPAPPPPSLVAAAARVAPSPPTAGAYTPARPESGGGAYGSAAAAYAPAPPAAAYGAAAQAQDWSSAAYAQQPPALAVSSDPLAAQPLAAAQPAAKPPAERTPTPPPAKAAPSTPMARAASSADLSGGGGAKLGEECGAKSDGGGGGFFAKLFGGKGLRGKKGQLDDDIKYVYNEEAKVRGTERRAPRSALACARLGRSPRWHGGLPAGAAAPPSAALPARARVLIPLARLRACACSCHLRAGLHP